MSQLTSLLDTKFVSGPSTSFEQPHVLFIFLEIGGNPSIGRQALAKKAGLGEGATRTILKRLREKGYAETRASGCFLTVKGTKLFRTVKSKLSEFSGIPQSKLTIGESQAGLRVRGGAASVRKGIEQRDSAIRAGASGATTYVIRDGRFAIPGGSSDCEKDFPDKAWVSMTKDLDPKNGDAVIVCGATALTTAKIGALAAAITLI